MLFSVDIHVRSEVAPAPLTRLQITQSQPALFGIAMTNATEHGTESLATSPPQSSGRKTGLILLITACGIGFFAVDVAAPYFMTDEPLLVMLTLAVLTAQMTVICAWGVLIRDTFWIRLPRTLFLLTVSWCGFTWGNSILGRAFPPDSIIPLGITWIYYFISISVPLKFAAWCFGWRIEQTTSANQNTQPNSRFAIRDMLVGTLLLSLALGIARLTLSQRSFSLNTPESYFFIVAFMVTMVYGVVALLIQLPCIWIALGEQPHRIPSRIALWVAYCFLLSMIEVILLAILTANTLSDFSTVYVGVFLGHPATGAIILGVFLALRGLGYQLKRSAEPQAQEPTPVVIDDSEAN
ncbi:MAG TPA: hypothetical protein DCY79_10085 [Planctomycetaceae bacterium]|nr:hypothetical protein [Planctomycetaceae bacterium]